MHFTPVALFLWAIGLVIHILLAIVLWKRHRAHIFPCFTAFVWSNIIKALVMYAPGIRGSQHAYLVGYFFFNILDVILELAVTWEVAAHIFRPAGIWAPEIHSGFISLVALSVSVALILAAMPVPPEKYILKSILDRLNVFCAALQCELFVLIMAVAVLAHLPWKTHVAAIAKGLGIFSLINLISNAGQAIVGLNSSMALSWHLTLFRITSYLVIAVYWIVALWQDAPATEPLSGELHLQLFALQNRLEYDLRRLRVLKR